MDTSDQVNEPCDSCGVDDLGRGLRLASVVVITAGGDLYLCDSHWAAHGPAVQEQGLTHILLSETLEAA